MRLRARLCCLEYIVVLCKRVSNLQLADPAHMRESLSEIGQYPNATNERGEKHRNRVRVSQGCECVNVMYNKPVGQRLRCVVQTLRTVATKFTFPIYAKAMLFLISAIAFAGFKPLGQVLEQFRMV